MRVDTPPPCQPAVAPGVVDLECFEALLSWQAIADELHVSKQAVHKKHRERRLFRRGRVT
jgi:hypothetical protein